MRIRPALALAAMAASLGPASESVAQEVNLSEQLPGALPSLSSWKRVTGAVDLEGPRRTIEYVFYVDPQHQALYTVTHYRISIDEMKDRERAGVSRSERLQWHTPEGALRRFECHRASPPGPYPCAWIERAPESQFYKNQLPLVLEIYELHRRLLCARVRGLIEHPP